MRSVGKHISITFTVSLACQLYMDLSNYLLHFMFHNLWDHKIGKNFCNSDFFPFFLISEEKEKVKHTL